MSREIDSIIVSPNTLGSYKFSGKPRENLALATLSSYLSSKGVTNEIIDARLNKLDPEQVADEIVAAKPKVVGLTLMSDEPAGWSKPLVERIKQDLPSTHIVAGSYFPSLDSERCFEVLPQIDSIAQGEGEETFLELILKVSTGSDWRDMNNITYRTAGGIQENKRRPLIADLDTLPEPFRYAKPGQVNKVSLEGSRGCFASCTFCSINPNLLINKSSWRPKTPGRIARELVNLRNKYPEVNQFRFVDSDFIGLGKNHQRLLELARRLSEAGFSPENSKIFVETQSRNVMQVPPNVWESLKKVGLYQVFMGVETGSEKEKKDIAKPSSFVTDLEAFDYLRQFGLNVTYGFIMITPWSNIANIYENVGALRKLGSAGLDKYFSELILTPGTKAFERVSQESGIYIEYVDNRERYFYPVPVTVDNIRHIGRFMLDSPTYKPFLVTLSSIYDRVDVLRSNGNLEAASKFRAALDELNLDIFLRVTDYCEDKDYLIDERTIEKFIVGIINEFNPKFLQIDNLIKP
jgi:anaerobic magnesium-protoporphyrin IX monomethyl ester cyclase